MSESTCSNCGEPHDAADVFCENCGFDFLTGSLPEEAAAAPNSFSPEAAPRSSAGPGVRITIAADRVYFDAVVTSGELDYPDPEPIEAVLTLPGPEIHIGRTSASRGIHPDIDVADLTNDPAVSSRHGIITVAEDGSATFTDVGSTNGTIIGEIEVGPNGPKLITPNQPIAVSHDTPIYLGAWTRITVEAPTEQ